jgi:hypothetical protein
MRPCTGVLLTLLLIPAQAGAAGRTAAAFLQRPLGAQSGGMGAAFVAVQSSIDSLQYNPSAIATLQKRTGSTSYLKSIADAGYGYFAYAHPSQLGTFAGSFTYFTAGKISLNLSDGTTGSVNAEQNFAYTATYARELAYGLHLGGTFRHVQLELAETATASSNQTDIGFLWRFPWKGFSAGASYQYVGPDITFESSGDPPPRTLRYGVAFRFPDVDPTKLDPSVDIEEFDVTVAVDNADVLHEDMSPRFGLEIGMRPPSMNRVAIRTGWISGRDTEGFTFGLGFIHKKIGFDYAFGNAPGLGTLQHFSISTRF